MFFACSCAKFAIPALLRYASWRWHVHALAGDACGAVSLLLLPSIGALSRIACGQTGD
jgi:hypothetical protein